VGYDKLSIKLFSGFICSLLFFNIAFYIIAFLIQQVWIMEQIFLEDLINPGYV